MLNEATIFLGSNNINNYHFFVDGFKKNLKILLCGADAFSRLTEHQKNLFDQIEIVKTIFTGIDGVEMFDQNDALSIVGKVLNDFKNVQLYCDDEKYLIIAALIREKFSLDGPKLHQTLCFRNKVMMKELVQSKEIAVPKFLSFDVSQFEEDSISYFNKIQNELGLPFVVKPIDLAGSYGVSIVDNYNCFSQLKTNVQFSYEAEEFIDGILYHYDAAIGEDQKIYFDEACEYINPLSSFLKGNLMGSIMLKVDPHKESIIEFGRNIINQLKIENTVIHLEVFKKKSGELIFLEIALRPAGAHIPEMYNKVINVNIFEQHFRRCS